MSSFDFASIMYSTVAGLGAGAIELTFGGQVLSIIMNRHAHVGDQSSIQILQGQKSFFRRYYGWPYVVNLLYRAPYISLVSSGLAVSSIVQTRMDSQPTKCVSILMDATIASILSLPVSTLGEFILVNSSNRDPKTLLKLSAGSIRAGMQRSLLATGLREAFYVAGMIAVPPLVVESIIAPKVPADIPSPVQYILASFILGPITALLSNPFHVVSVTQQTSQSNSNLLQTIKDIYKLEGFWPFFYKALFPRAVRMSVCSPFVVLGRNSILEWLPNNRKAHKMASKAP